MLRLRGIYPWRAASAQAQEELAQSPYVLLVPEQCLFCPGLPGRRKAFTSPF